MSYARFAADNARIEFAPNPFGTDSRERAQLRMLIGIMRTIADGIQVEFPATARYMRELTDDLKRDNEERAMDYEEVEKLRALKESHARLLAASEAMLEAADIAGWWLVGKYVTQMDDARAAIAAAQKLQER